MADDRTYIRLHDGMPGHPKVRGLSDKAFRTLIRAWCYCSEYLTDGEIVTVVARDFGTTKAWDELVSAGLAESAPSGYLMHDYLEHQRSAAEVAEIKAGRGAGGGFGNHVKWHVKRRKPNPECEHCRASAPIANGSQERSEDESQSDRSPSHRSETETQAETEEKNSSKGGSHVSRGSSAAPPLFPDHCQPHADVAEPGNCGPCGDRRRANRAKAEQLPDYRLRVVPPLCGQCDERWVETPSGVEQCPRCHPSAVNVTTPTRAMCSYHPEHLADDCRSCTVAREQYKREMAANQ